MVVLCVGRELVREIGARVRAPINYHQMPAVCLLFLSLSSTVVSMVCSLARYCMEFAEEPVESFTLGAVHSLIMRLPARGSELDCCLETRPDTKRALACLLARLLAAFAQRPAWTCKEHLSSLPEMTSTGAETTAKAAGRCQQQQPPPCRLAPTDCQAACARIFYASRELSQHRKVPYFWSFAGSACSKCLI